MIINTTVTSTSTTLKNSNPEGMSRSKQVHGGITHIMPLPDWQLKGKQYYS